MMWKKCHILWNTLHPAAHCSEHRTVNEMRDMNPACTVSPCLERPYYVAADTINKRKNGVLVPERYSRHRLDDVNITEKPCSSCGLPFFLPNNVEMCKDCSDYIVRKVPTSKKEMLIKRVLETNCIKIASHGLILCKVLASNIAQSLLLTMARTLWWWRSTKGRIVGMHLHVNKSEWSTSSKILEACRYALSDTIRTSIKIRWARGSTKECPRVISDWLTRLGVWNKALQRSFWLSYISITMVTMVSTGLLVLIWIKKALVFR